MDSLEQTLATVHDLLWAERLEEAAALLRRCPASMEQVGYDNWNGCKRLYPQATHASVELGDRLRTVSVRSFC